MGSGWGYIYICIYIYGMGIEWGYLAMEREREVSGMAGLEIHARNLWRFVGSPASHDDTKWYPNLPSGKHTKNYGKSQFSMGK